MAHDHHHPPPQPDHPEPKTEYEILGMALNELLLEKGIFTADEQRKTIEMLENVTPADGAKVVARAWVDPEYRQRLRTDAPSAVAEMDIDHSQANLTVLENTPSTHNVVVCTLCSCYPRMLLGRPPAWYKSKPYRSRVVREPRQVLAEFGTTIEPSREVRVHDSTAELRYLVIPMRPENTDGWSETELVKLITRDSMIGVAEALPPSA
jgi:nitrile hydratase alpha subunit